MLSQINARTAQGTTDLLRKELNDNVGALSLARERVTKLETLVENITHKTVRRKSRCRNNIELPFSI